MVNKVALREYVDALREADRRYLDARIDDLKEAQALFRDELEKSIDRRFGAQYSITPRLMPILTGLGVLVAVLAAIIKWRL